MTLRYGAAVAAVLLASLAISGAPARAQEKARDFEGITVQGTGQIQIKPDIARLTLGVQTDGPDSASAARDNAVRTSRVIAAVRAAGVAEKDIQTTDYAIHPRYRQDPKPVKNQTPKIVGYTIRNTVEVTVRKLGDIGKVIDRAVAGGANLADGIGFDLDDDTAARSQALQKAVADAAGKARVIAQAAQEDFGVDGPRVRLVAIVEETVNMPRYSAMFESRGMYYSGTPIQAGEQTVTATVIARYIVVK